MRARVLRSTWPSRLDLATMVLMMAGVATGGIQTAKAQDLPEGKGKDIVENVCSQCHGLKQVTDSARTPDEWKDLVNEMIGNGAQLDDEQIPIVIDYLAKSFPKGSKVNVNKAAAEELADDLKLSGDEAAAIVTYREQNGHIKDWDDLGKVPGLDIKKLEPMKSHILYQ
jgi:competence ComEA-like helix-hairpin-helix protein